MALRLHLAPRYLQIRGQLADPINPMSSILAGCGCSILLTRILRRRDVGQLVDEHTAVRHSVYVEDTGQTVVGTEKRYTRNYGRRLWIWSISAVPCTSVSLENLP